MTHLLVTNDFPPKLGGIQSYLWELWRRLPPTSFTVLTTPHPDAAAWDADQPFRVVRTDEPVLLPTPGLRRRIDQLATEIGAGLVVLDPALPVGAIGPALSTPYGLVLHGAEVTVPGRLPGTRQALRRVLVGAHLIVAAGGYPLAEAEHAAGVALPNVVVPPGVDVDRFRPLDAEAKRVARVRLGLPDDATVVLGLSRLVPRKGFDALIASAASIAPRHPEMLVVIGGSGRDRPRLDRLAARSGAPVRFLGRVDDDDLPALFGCADVFAMLCRNRWAGLEQEGFGIVFVEAAAAGVPQIAGRSGGAHEAVEHGRTGLVVDRPHDPDQVARALELLVGDAALRARLGRAARRRVETHLTYDVLADRLGKALGACR
jgi:phosphatidyl-myo-inositol dimannoside synthase